MTNLANQVAKHEPKIMTLGYYINDTHGYIKEVSNKVTNILSQLNFGNIPAEEPKIDKEPEGDIATRYFNMLNGIHKTVEELSANIDKIQSIIGEQ